MEKVTGEKTSPGKNMYIKICFKKVRYYLVVRTENVRKFVRVRKIVR